MKHYRVNFIAPITFDYTVDIDEEELGGKDINEYLKDNMKNISDCLYHEVCDDVSWYIEKYIRVKNIRVIESEQI